MPANNAKILAGAKSTQVADIIPPTNTNVMRAIGKRNIFIGVEYDR